MNTISIVVRGEELENLSIELTAEEVAALYKLRKDNTTKIVELEKEISDIKRNNTYQENKIVAMQSELLQAHTLLTALGVQDKTLEEEVYYRKCLSMSTRIALFIAGKTNFKEC